MVKIVVLFWDKNVSIIEFLYQIDFFHLIPFHKMNSNNQIKNFLNYSARPSISIQYFCIKSSQIIEQLKWLNFSISFQWTFSNTKLTLKPMEQRIFKIFSYYRGQHIQGIKISLASWIKFSVESICNLSFFPQTKCLSYFWMITIWRF